MGEKTGNFSWILFTLNSVPVCSPLLKLKDRAYNCNNFGILFIFGIRFSCCILISWGILMPRRIVEAQQEWEEGFPILLPIIQAGIPRATCPFYFYSSSINSTFCLVWMIETDHILGVRWINWRLCRWTLVKFHHWNWTICRLEISWHIMAHMI